MNAQQADIIKRLKDERDAFVQRVKKAAPNDAIRVTSQSVLRTYDDQIQRAEESFK